jgi:hypothetical protein
MYDALFAKFTRYRFALWYVSHRPPCVMDLSFYKCSAQRRIEGKAAAERKSISVE